MSRIDPADTQWWRTAVIYQIYPRSFADSNGDGIGDLAGITAQLDHVVRLGADAIWLSPFYPSPHRDGGYDVANYRDVDPRYGDLASFDTLLARAHDGGLRVIVDLVPNHSSSDHPAFQAALADRAGSAARDRYIFRNGRGPGGSQPPNNWQCMFEGPAWTRVIDQDGKPGQWYLHLFDPSQPDWNWDNPLVRDDFEETLRFWLDRGVDGFRVDVCDALIKAEGLPDWNHATHGVITQVDGAQPPMWDQEGIHEIYRSWRRILDTFEGTRILCAEAWLPPERAARIVRPGEMHQAFNFSYLELAWDAKQFRMAMDQSLTANGAVGAPTTWVLSNHDVMRHASRFGYEGAVALESGVGADDPQPDREKGLRRARAATALMLALPGSAYLYQGEELGLPEVSDLPDEVRQDPVWERSNHQIRGRDGCRVPLPWTSTGPSFGFSTVSRPWLPQPRYFGEYSVEVQERDDRSTLALYRKLLMLRRQRSMGTGTLRWLETPTQVLCFANEAVGVLTNMSPQRVPLPNGEVLFSSEPENSSQDVPPDTTVWFATAGPS